MIALALSAQTHQRIGDELLMGSDTVKTRLSPVFAKLDATNRAMVAAIAELHEPPIPADRAWPGLPLAQRPPPPLRDAP